MISWPNLCCSVDWNKCDRKMSWSNLKWYADGNFVTGSFQDQIDVLCGLEKMVDDNVMNEFEVIFV
jgi:hypothetical protein